VSAGVFLISRYAASYDTDAIHPIRVQPETVEASVGGTTNAAPTGAITNPISASISLGVRALGLRPRIVTLKSPETNPPAGYAPLSNTRIPALNQAFWDACLKGTDVSYLGATFTVVSRDTEQAA
jgi:hypothetical protein